MKHHLTYDAALASENSWRLGPTSRTIEARVRVASAEEVSIEVPVRRSASTGRHDGRAFLRALDGVDWWVAGGQYADALPRLDLVLKHAPQSVQMRLWAIP